MLKKLWNVVFTVIGMIIGYGAYQLAAYIMATQGYDLDDHLSATEELFVVAIIAIIFGIIFYKLTPVFTRQGRKAAVNIESDLKKTSTNDLITTSVGLIVGLIIAYLMSGLYEGVTIPILQVIKAVFIYVIIVFRYELF